ncbi:hypothetical protein [Nostoc punctiforme]|jgi:hypothetical protein|nr:hypothetical protein [Nostoc punctiforme]
MFVNLGRLEVAATQTCVERSRNTKPASAGYKTIDFALVHGGGQC